MSQKQSDKDKLAAHVSDFSNDPESDNVGMDNARTAKLPRTTGSFLVPKNTKEHTYRSYRKTWEFNEPQQELTQEEIDMGIELSPICGKLHYEAIFDFWKFIDLINMFGGIKGFDPEFHKDMCDHVGRPQMYNIDERRRMGLVPRAHAKSTIGTVAYSLWRIYRNPNIRICVGTATTGLAKQFVIQVKQYLEDPTLQDSVWNNRPHYDGRLVPILDKAGNSRRNQKWDLGDYTEAEDKKVIWRADAVQVNRSVIYKEPTIIAASPKSNITGMHFDLVILDDIINDDSVSTPEKREKTLVWTRDLESVIDPERSVPMGDKTEWREVIGDELVIWGTRYHLEDYYQYNIDNKEDFEIHMFFRNVYKNGVDNSDGYLWGERFTDKTVNKIRKRQGVIRFSSQYLNKVVASVDVVFPTENIRYISPSSVEPMGYGKYRIFKKATNPGEEDSYVDIKLNCCVDIAASLDKRADFSCVAVGGLDHERTLYVLDLSFGRWLPAELISETYKLLDKYELNSFKMDCTGTQQIMLSSFKAVQHNYRPVAIIPVKQSNNKEDRIKFFLQPLFDNNQIYLANWMKNVQELQNEFDYFPSVHDDLVDTIAMIVEAGTPTKKSKPKKVNGYGQSVILGKFAVNSKYGGRLR